MCELLGGVGPVSRACWAFATLDKQQQHEVQCRPVDLSSLAGFAVLLPQSGQFWNP